MMARSVVSRGITLISVVTMWLTCGNWQFCADMEERGTQTRSRQNSTAPPGLRPRKGISDLVSNGRALPGRIKQLWQEDLILTDGVGTFFTNDSFPWHRLLMARRCPGAFWWHLLLFVSSWCSSLLRLDLFVQPQHHALLVEPEERLRSFLALTNPNFAPKSKVFLLGTPAGGSAVALRVAEQPILLGAARNVQKTPIVEFGLFVLHKICACWDAGMASFLDLLTQMSGASPADPPCGPQVHPD